MGLWKGAVTARRYRVVGQVPQGWREAWRERLDAMAFREPTGTTGKEELEGWVQIHNLLDTSFSRMDRWLYDPFAVFALRVDKKTLPAKLFSATVEKRCEAWCAERGTEKVPAAVKREIKEQLEEEWLARALPRVTLVEVSWNVRDGWALVGTTSEKACDRVRTRFHRTFGLELQPWSPLDFVEDAGTRSSLVASGPSAFGGEA
ncbi:MAG: recombination-associated protein RdgC [Alphaproteobacteria bacterium]|nr:recombination-associated protein RdgC [Alphaproteobacteria bacterium]